jgi:hypothetical protein
MVWSIEPFGDWAEFLRVSLIKAKEESEKPNITKELLSLLESLPNMDRDSEISWGYTWGNIKSSQDQTYWYMWSYHHDALKNISDMLKIIKIRLVQPKHRIFNLGFVIPR